MSTYIFDAFRLPPEKSRLSSLIDLGSELKAIHEKSIDADYISQIRTNEFTMANVRSLKGRMRWDGLSQKEIEFILFSMGYALAAVSALYTYSGTYIMRDLEAFHYFRDRYFEMHKHEKPKDFEQYELAMDAVSCDVYEVLNRSGSRASVYFLAARDGSVYVKPIAASSAVLERLKEIAEPFDYTNATEMLVSDFPKDIQEAYEKLRSDDDKYELLSKAQTKRGDQWDEALRGAGRYCDAGLSFDLAPDYNTMLRQHINRILANLFGLKKFNADAN